jgi:TolB-like protein/DNA-binding winged helix-turn-helix (wHTH) protein/lipoprotein NlpI
MKYTLSDLRIDTGRQVVSRGVNPVPLPKLSYDLFLVLVRAAPNLVSLDELMRLVWPGVVVSPETVSQRVKLLRDALADDPRAPRYIAGLRGRGYQVIAAVEEVGETPAVTPGAPNSSNSMPVLPPLKVSASKDQDNFSEGLSDMRALPTDAAKSAVVHRLRRFVLRNGSLLGVGAVALAAILAAVGYALYRESRAQVTVSVKAVAVPAAPSPASAVAAFAPPPHSIAVLPFVNLSGDKEQEYFSDGLTEELLNSLAEIDGLQVAARTSSFSFKEHPDIATVAHRLNVGAVLEGSVRRSANTIRISAQLVNAVTGFHLWSKTYDRDLGDVLKLQTEIATAVASALKVTLLGDVAAKVELGGTRNPAAFDAYLRGAKADSSIRDTKDLPAAIAAYTEAIRLDPHYALAFASRSIAHSYIAGDAGAAEAMREGYDKAQADAHQALALAPDLAQAHLALAYVSEQGNLDFTQASEAYERAVALAPGSAQVLRLSGIFAALMGHFDAGVAAARRAVVLDPLARESHARLGQALYVARRYEEAVAAFAEVISLEPDFKLPYPERGLAYYGLWDLQSARASCETAPDDWENQQCLALIYDKLGRHADAEAVLTKYRASMGDASAYQYATIYAQWGNRAKGLEWLETALRLRDPGLEHVKTDPLLDSLRKEPRFQAIERELKFPPQ